MRFRGLWTLLAITLALGHGGETARADIDGDTFTSGAPWRIRITAPVNWRLSEQRSYGSASVRRSGRRPRRRTSSRRR